MILTEVSTVFDENSCSDEMCLSSVGQTNFLTHWVSPVFESLQKTEKAKKRVGGLISDKLSVSF